MASLLKRNAVNDITLIVIIFIVAAIAGLMILLLYIPESANSPPEAGAAAEPSLTSPNTQFDIYSVIEILIPFAVALIVAVTYLLTRRRSQRVDE